MVTSSQTAPTLINPGNWHWMTKNCLAWAKEYLETKLIGLTAEDGSTSCKLVEVPVVEGDADVNMRKGKVTYIFDLKVEMKWSGKTSDDTEVRGRLTFPSASYDDSPAEYESELTVDEESNAKRPVKELVRKRLREKINEVFEKFPKDLLAEHAESVLVPGGGAPQQPPASKDSVKIAKPHMDFGVPKPKSDVLVTKIQFETEFKASAADLYACFTDPQRVAAWTGGSSQFKPEVNAEFHLLGGNIAGKNLQLEPAKKIKQTWRLKNWPEGHYSTVELNFKQGADTTTLEVVQTSVPKSEEDDIKEKWNNNIFDRIKQLFGYGI